MLIKNTISPKTFERKNNEIDHWFTNEKENINWRVYLFDRA